MINFSEFKKILKHIDTLAWHRKEGFVPDQEVYNSALKNFSSFTEGHTKGKIIFRTIGQSGSGKTTQLLRAAKFYCESKNISPVHICVREFSELHPNYAKLLAKFGASKMREITNEFSLKCALISLILALEEGFDVVLEITLLSEEFENFVDKYISKFGFKIIYLCVSVNKSLSDCLIGRRMSDQNSAESGRIVASSSSEFFYNALISSLKKKSEYSEDRIIIWNIYDPLPVFDGKIKDCLNAFDLQQKKTSRDFANEQKLLDAKKDYLIKNC